MISVFVEHGQWYGGNPHMREARLIQCSVNEWNILATSLQQAEQLIGTVHTIAAISRR